jgi:hypothetical protein
MPIRRRPIHLVRTLPISIYCSTLPSSLSHVTLYVCGFNACGSFNVSAGCDTDRVGASATRGVSPLEGDFEVRC